MIRKVVMGFALCALMAGCGSTGEKQTDDAPETMAATDSGEVKAMDMKFDAGGSDSGNIPGLNTVNFEYDKSSLTTATRKLLAENADWIRANKFNIQIEGHCDNRGTVEYNLALGQRRADAVRDYLVNLGIDPNRLNVLSYGEEKPVASGDDEMSWSKNRRANFVPLPQ